MGAAFFMHPVNYLLTWFFLCCLVFLYKDILANIYRSLYALYKQNGRVFEIMLLALITLAGFMLRFNGYAHHSAWNDELYSANIAANPESPLLNTFADPGNPPFYFILLRLWFKLFGWSEQSGRFLSVLLGTAAIVSIYRLLGSFSCQKAAFFAALLMAVNNYVIGYSQEMRGYILEVFFVSIIALQLLLFVDKQKFKNLFWYTLFCILLVNTHYYGILMVMSNFLFFVYILIRYKNIKLKMTVVFILGNILIAVSFLPFFIYTAFQQALLDNSFNTWLSRPGMGLILLTVIVPFFLALYFHIRGQIFQKWFTGPQSRLLDHAVFSICVIFALAVLVSMLRPIYQSKYLVICFPFLLVLISLVLAYLFDHIGFLVVRFCVIVLLYSFMLTGYESKQGGGTDVYQESHAYIIRDAGSHPDSKSAERFNPGMIELYRERYDHYAAFYGYSRLHFWLAGIGGGGGGGFFFFL
jgi:4-amino-4-deoxy-L-arabinose transferase-like glycosyltransferase